MGRSGKIDVWLANHRRAFLVLLVAVLAIVPVVANAYVIFVMSRMLIYVLLIVGFTLILGYLGQLVFANVAFYGIGAYGTGILMIHFGWDFLSAIIVAAGVTATIALLISLTVLRGSRGLYLAIITFAFSEVMHWAYTYGGSVTGGTSGLEVDHFSMLSLSVNSGAAKYLTILLVVVVVTVWCHMLMRGRYGRALVAIREHAAAAEALGVGARSHLFATFALSGAMVGLAGGLHLLLVGRITPLEFGLPELLLQFGMVTVGGLGSVLGACIGAASLSLIPEFFRSFPGAYELVVAIVMLGVLLFLPGGLVALVRRLVPGFADRRQYRE